METRIEQELSGAGYRMLGDDRSIKRLIISILKSSDTRYLKAIPFLIYRYDLDISGIYRSIRQKEKFDALLKMTAKIFREFNIPKKIPHFGEGDIDLKSDFFKEYKLNYEEFRDEFELQLRNERNNGLLIDKQRISAERDLHYWLSQLFTKKERHIIDRMLRDLPVSKTDYEYYSRKTKKKLMAIDYLNDFAKTLSNRRPIYSEELFDLKKWLELFLEQYTGKKGIKILDYFIWEHDKISIKFTTKEDDYFQIRNTNIPLRSIEDSDIRRLLERCPQHDFR